MRHIDLQACMYDRRGGTFKAGITVSRRTCRALARDAGKATSYRFFRIEHRMHGITRVDDRLQGLAIGEERALDLAEYGRVSIAFEIEQVLEPTFAEDGLGGIFLRGLPAAIPRRKDYDEIPGNAPAEWPNQFNLASWGLIAARLEGELGGGAMIAHDTPDTVLLEGRRDLAVVWDLRVAPEFRRLEIGGALWRAVEIWAARRACRQLKVETQNTNAGACRFYARQGCYLGAVNRNAYPELPEEIQLLWYKDLPLRE